jgi:uncharacterized protein YktB (UPF0637 family)
MTTITVHAKDKKHLSKIKAALKLIDTVFEEKEDLSNSELVEQKEYNPDFVKKIEERMNNVKNGKYIIVTEDYKKELFGL